MERLIDSIANLDAGAGDSPTLGVELNGRGAGTVEVVEELCEGSSVVPVVNVAECISRSERSEFAEKLAALLELASRYSAPNRVQSSDSNGWSTDASGRSTGRSGRSTDRDGQSADRSGQSTDTGERNTDSAGRGNDRGGRNPIWIRYRALNQRVPVGVSEGWPDFRTVLREIWRFENAGGPEVCILLDSPRREWDAVLISSYRHMLESGDSGIDSLSAEGIVRSGSPRVVDVGSQVLLRDVSRSQQLRYVIVEPGLADPFSDRISYESPIGRSLLGKESGSLIEIAAPGGSYVYEVIDIR